MQGWDFQTLICLEGRGEAPGAFPESEEDPRLRWGEETLLSLEKAEPRVSPQHIQPVWERGQSLPCYNQA